MFSWFKRSKTTIEEQLNKLEELRVRLKEKVNINDCLEFKQHDYEKKPYILLLISMGSEIPREDSYTFPSDDVWYFDRECIEETGDYVRVLKRIAELMKDEIVVTDISDFIDIENNEVQVSFKINRAEYKFSLIAKDDWLDINIFRIFSKVLEEHGSTRRFFFSDIDQSLLVVLIHKKQYKSLNGLLNIFIPANLEEGKQII